MAIALKARPAVLVKMSKPNWWGLFLAITFMLCVIWGLLFPHTALQQALLEAVFPGFTWLSWTTLLLGLVEAFLYGIFAAAVFVPLYNGLSSWTGHAETRV